MLRHLLNRFRPKSESLRPRSHRSFAPILERLEARNLMSADGVGVGFSHCSSGSEHVDATVRLINVHNPSRSASGVLVRNDYVLTARHVFNGEHKIASHLNDVLIVPACVNGQPGAGGASTIDSSRRYSNGGAVTFFDSSLPNRDLALVRLDHAFTQVKNLPYRLATIDKSWFTESFLPGKAHFELIHYPGEATSPKRDQLSKSDINVHPIRSDRIEYGRPLTKPGSSGGVLFTAGDNDASKNNIIVGVHSSGDDPDAYTGYGESSRLSPGHITTIQAEMTRRPTTAQSFVVERDSYFSVTTGVRQQTKVINKTSFKQGDQLVFRLRLFNAGDAPATGASIRIWLQPYDSNDFRNPNIPYEPRSKPFSLAPGEIREIEYRVEVPRIAKPQFKIHWTLSDRPRALLTTSPFHEGSFPRSGYLGFQPSTSIPPRAVNTSLDSAKELTTAEAAEVTSPDLWYRLRVPNQRTALLIEGQGLSAWERDESLPPNMRIELFDASGELLRESLGHARSYGESPTHDPAEYVFLHEYIESTDEVFIKVSGLQLGNWFSLSHAMEQFDQDEFDIPVDSVWTPLKVSPLTATPDGTIETSGEVASIDFSADGSVVGPASWVNIVLSTDTTFGDAEDHVLATLPGDSEHVILDAEFNLPTTSSAFWDSVFQENRETASVFVGLQYDRPIDRQPGTYVNEGDTEGVDYVQLVVKRPPKSRSYLLDVDGDGLVAPIDALLVINELNERGSHAFGKSSVDQSHLDVNGDGQLSAIDVLQIINYLNSPKTAEGEYGSPPMPRDDTISRQRNSEVSKDRTSLLAGAEMKLHRSSAFMDIADGFCPYLTPPRTHEELDDLLNLLAQDVAGHDLNTKCNKACLGPDF